VRSAAAILLAASPLTRNQQRLAKDIVASAAFGVAGPAGTVTMAEFRYPPIAAAQLVRAGSPERALRAFMSKQTQGSPGLKVLLCRDAAGWFTGWYAEPLLEIDNLADLQGDAGRKRALWARISGIASAPE